MSRKASQGVAKCFSGHCCVFEWCVKHFPNASQELPTFVPRDSKTSPKPFWIIFNFTNLSNHLLDSFPCISQGLTHHMGHPWETLWTFVDQLSKCVHYLHRYIYILYVSCLSLSLSFSLYPSLSLSRFLSLCIHIIISIYM